MPTWLWFAPFGLLVVALAVWGFRLGWVAVTITETDVIEAYTARYLSEQGSTARVTDCVARPGQNAPVWIVVTCTTATDIRVEFPVDRLGRLLDLQQPYQASPAPQT